MLTRFLLWLFQILFCAWTAPRTWVTGETVTAAVCNSAIRDNFTYIKTQQDLDDTHRAATSAIHGLPANAYVLGNKGAAGEFVQRSSQSITTGGGAVTLYMGNATVTFAVAFSGVPVVVTGAVTEVAGNPGSGGYGVGTTGFTIQRLSDAGGATGSVHWIALGV